MMQRKKKILAVFFAAISASLFVPTLSKADEAIAITATECGLTECKSHTITANDVTGNKRIQVSGGRHKITLDGVSIEATDGYSAFDITGGAEVELTLIGDNILKGANGCAGLHIPSDCSLTILGEGNLTAHGGNNGAGIGSQGVDGASGTVTISSTGTIEAYGGDTAAGIGGGQGGGCGKVTINSGTVKAYGGDGYTIKDPATGIESKKEGGTGIGTGGGGVGGGEIILKGGEVTAIGGMSNDEPQRNGIDCATLSSDGGSANLYSNSPISSSTNIDDFNGIVWLMQKETNGNYKTISGSVYGKNAVLDKNITDISLSIRPGCSLTIPSNKKITIDGTGVIFGDKTTSIINADNLIVAGKIILSDDIQKKVTLSIKDIVIKKPDLTYTGLVLDKEAYEIKSPRVDNGRTYDVDESGWVPTFYKNSRIVDHILEEGTYDVKYKNTNPNANYPDFNFKITISKADFNKVTVDPIDDVIYNGKPQEPKLTVKFNNTPLVEGVDYQKLTSSSYENNTEVGTAKVTLKASENGNFLSTTPKTVTFQIKAAILSEDNVAISSDSAVYNGKKQEPTITVSLGENEPPLILDKDYKITASSNDFVSANSDNPTTYTIEGIGAYTGTITKTFTITEKDLSISEITAKDRQFDGTTFVDIEKIKYDGLVDGDKNSDIILTSQGIIESPNVNDGEGGGYKTVQFKEFILDKENGKGRNYYIASPLPDTDISLAVPVKISQADAPDKPALGETHTVSETSPDKFTCTLEVKNPKEGAVYEYRMDSKDLPETEGWQDSPVFDNIEPESVHLFEARSKLDPNVKQSEIGEEEFTFDLLEETNKPADIKLTFSPNTDEQTFTGTISSDSKLDNVEYFIGKTGVEPKDEDYQSGDGAQLKTDCESNTEYTAYVRFKKTKTHKPSEPTTTTNSTNRLVAKPPIITPEDGTEFYESQEVTITHKLDGMTIYYTTDGTEPTLESPIYTEPFEITDTTTIKAFAVKNNMDDSEVATATLTLKLRDVEKPVIDPEGESEFTGSRLVEITCETEDATIYYTVDGSDPTTESKKYTEPFRVSTTTVVKAIGVKEGLNNSEIATATLNKSESAINVHAFLNPFITSGDGIENNIISDELMSKLDTTDKAVATESIYQTMTQELSVIGNHGDFTYLKMNFYDLVVKVKIDSDPLRDATLDDFAEGGYTITIPYPDGTSLEANDFAIAHMVASGEKTGNVETWYADKVTKTPYGLQFNITSASPLAIAWTAAVPGGPNSNNVSDGDNVVNPDGENPGGDDPNGDNPDGENPDGENPDGENPAGDDQNNGIVTSNPKTDADGAAAAGNGAGTGSVTDAVKSALSSLLPKTGDTNKIIAWVVVLAASIAVIVGLRIKSKKASGKPKKKR